MAAICATSSPSSQKSMPQLDEKGTLDEQLLRHAYSDLACRSRSLSGAAWVGWRQSRYYLGEPPGVAEVMPSARSQHSSRRGVVTPIRWYRSDGAPSASNNAATWAGMCA